MLTPRPSRPSSFPTIGFATISTPHILTLHDSDNIALALPRIESGEALAPSGVVAKETVPSGHKIALKPIGAGQKVIKYGRVIGVATQDIQAGEHVHVHNVAMTSFHRNKEYGRDARDTDIQSLSERVTFDGYRRANGGVGTLFRLWADSAVDFFPNSQIREFLALGRVFGYSEVETFPQGENWVKLPQSKMSLSAPAVVWRQSVAF